MPELAEVEIVVRNLRRWWLHKTASQLQILDPKLLSSNTSLENAFTQPTHDITRRGKYILVHTQPDHVLVFHLRMTGKIIRMDELDTKHARIGWFVPDTGWLVFHDVRRLGTLTHLSQDTSSTYKPLASMGPEPYDLTFDDFFTSLQSTRRLKDLLLDQSIIAGVGNIAISEIFWRLRLPTAIKGNELTEEQIRALMAELPAYFDWLIEEESSDEVVYLGQQKAYNPFSIYKRQNQPCPRCETNIERKTVGSRTSYFCPSCQGS